MSIEGKHAYRFGYLKSEQWQTVRIEALAREKAKCQICGEESLQNDAHHVWYPENIYETKEHHLVVMCRPCHEFIHVMMPECKTRDHEKGMTQWITFRNAIVNWRRAKMHMFTTADGMRVIDPKPLREELDRLKCQLNSKAVQQGLISKKDVTKYLSKLREMTDSFEKKFIKSGDDEMQIKKAS